MVAKKKGTKSAARTARKPAKKPEQQTESQGTVQLSAKLSQAIDMLFGQQAQAAQPDPTAQAEHARRVRAEQKLHVTLEILKSPAFNGMPPHLARNDAMRMADELLDETLYASAVRAIPVTPAAPIEPIELGSPEYPSDAKSDTAGPAKVEPAPETKS